MSGRVWILAAIQYMFFKVRHMSIMPTAMATNPPQYAQQDAAADFFYKVAELVGRGSVINGSFRVLNISVDNS